jgi:hypothetical protein
MSSGSMPRGVYETLRQRAGAAGQPLQDYLRPSLEEQPQRPTIREMFDRVGRRTGGTLPLKYATRVIREGCDAQAS